MLKHDEESMQLLVSIGLTVNQAKIYLSNLHVGLTTAKVLSDYSKIGREDVYRLLPSLQDNGLIIKHITSPTLFEAVPLKDAINLLLKNKEEEFSGIKKKAYVFVSNLGTRNVSINAEVEPILTLFTRDNPELGPSIKDIKKTEKSYCFATRHHEFIQFLNNGKYEPIIDEFYNIAERGVKIRLILDGFKTEKLLEEFNFENQSSNKLIKNKNFQYKLTVKPLETLLAIIDGKIAYIWTDSSERFAFEPFLWTNNPTIVNLATTYFSSLWKSAKIP